MKKWMALLVIMAVIWPAAAHAGDMKIWRLVDENGGMLTEICEEPDVGDEYISADNRLYQVVAVEGTNALTEAKGTVDLPDLQWMDADTALPVAAMQKKIALYCTHSDESYEPSDGYYSTTERGSIYQVAQALADGLGEKGVDAVLADTLHHPHDAGAYRRSRQTAVQLLKELPDCLIDVHRDGIPDPDSYAVTIGGEPVSKIRLLVGRGNQNAEMNREFALKIKAVADRVYPGLIKDIYLGKGAFNQDLLARSILLECGTYTLEKERVLASMSMMADVLNRSLYGGIVGSAGQRTSDVQSVPEETTGITIGEPDVPAAEDDRGLFGGLGFLGILLLIGIGGYAILSTGSFMGGKRKASRNLSEMTGGLLGKKPKDGENPQHS